MDLIEILETLPKIQDDECYSEKTKLRVIRHIFFNDLDYSVGVQASFYHYCIPRETLDLNEYTHFEVILDIPDEDVPTSWEEFNYCGDKVYGYVPKDAIEQLLEELANKYRITPINYI